MIKRDKFRFYRSETLEHQLMKKYVFENFTKSNLYRDVVMEYDLGERIADVYIELMNGKKIVIECQHSFITPEEIKQRTKFYNSLNMYVLWILNGINFKKKPQNENGVVFYTHEKTLFYLYRERVYYLNVSKDGIEGEIYPLYFAPYFEIKRNNYTKKKKYFKGKRSTVVGDIPSYELVFYENGYKIARFMDKNLKLSCAIDIKDYLIQIKPESSFKFILNRKSQKLIKVPLKEIIHQLKEKYGVYLPYQVLKDGKVPIEDIKYLKSKRGFYREFVLFDKGFLERELV
jgi:competence CoiA-like predicted nuclease